MDRLIPSQGLRSGEEIKEKYWMPLEACHKTGAWEALDACYSECHRAYHTWEHIGGLLEKLSVFSNLAARPDLIATSAFWHDSVYQTQNHDGTPRLDYDNVHNSAELFRRYTLLNQTDAGAVYDMIMATANHMQARAEELYYAGFSDDLDLFLDLDLSSLAAPWEKFAEHLAWIRKEFLWAPELVFCSAHLRILENFAKEDARLYRRAETNGKWHTDAKVNLERCIADLKKRIAALSLD